MTENSTYLDADFNLDTQDGSEGFEILPRGQYPAFIESATLKYLKSGRGQAVELVWVIESGRFANRKIWQNVIIQHDSERALDIGRRMFKDVCCSCGLTGNVRNLTELHNHVCMVSIVVEEDRDGQYAPKNVVKRVRKITKPDNSNGNGSTFKPVGEAAKKVAAKAAPAPQPFPFNDDVKDV